MKRKCPLDRIQRKIIWNMAHSLKINLEWEGGDWVSLNEHNDEDTHFVGTWEHVSKELISLSAKFIKDGECLITFEKNVQVKDYLLIALNFLRIQLADFKRVTHDLFKEGG